MAHERGFLVSVWNTAPYRRGAASGQTDGMNARHRERTQEARKVRRSPAERGELLEEFKGSDLSQAAFSRQEEIPLSRRVDD